MAYQNSNNYLTIIVPETTYGAQVKNLSTGVALCSKFDWKNEPITVERTCKEGNLYKKPTRNTITAKKITGTLSGDLTDSHEILLKGHFDDTTSPYLYAAGQPTTLSYNVYRAYLNPATGAVATYDVLLGCVFNPLQISGEPASIVQFSCSVEAATFLESVANSAGNALSNVPVPSGAAFKFGNTTVLGANGATTLLSFSLNLEKTMVADAQRYQNSMTKISDNYTQVGGTLDVKYLWDTVNDVAMNGSVANETDVITTITLKSDAKTWAMAVYGVLTSADKADAERELFEAAYSYDLCEGAGGEVPITITVASV
jgi:hypothetical protein